MVNGLLAPLAVVGTLTVCTYEPPAVYSSKYTAAVTLLSAAEPSPRRTTTRSPAPNPDAKADPDNKAANEKANNRFIRVPMLKAFANQNEDYQKNMGESKSNLL
jgi:hypothetical protein